MNHSPLLYIGIAAPLVEQAQVWLVSLADLPTRPERLARLQTFPRRDINAYKLEFLDTDYTMLTFRTGELVPHNRVRTAIEAWLGKPPELLPTPHLQPIPALDHGRALTALHTALQTQPVHLVRRVGLTLQQLQRDLQEYRPALVLLNCHGTSEGCLLLEDGRGRADVVSGERLFPLLQPRPQVLFLSACHSEGVLRRAKDTAHWEGSAIVYINASTPVEVTACVAFETMFYTTLLHGVAAQDAFEAAQQYVANDPECGDLSVLDGEIPPSQKFCLTANGQNVRLPMPAAVPSEPQQDAPPMRYPNRLRRASERFVGRRREMQQIIDALLPTRVGIERLGGERRVTTLIKEGGIGKTALALEVVDWTHERRVFPGGIFELSCEHLLSDQEFLIRWLTLLGLPPEHHEGDLLALVAAVLSQVIPAGQPALLLLDNLDDLCGQHVAPDIRNRTTQMLETAITTVPTLRILATCRWPVGLADHELPLEIPPMHADEARDVFISHVDEPTHRLEARQTWSQADSPIRQLIRLSGRHPQSLRLLARQMGRKGLTLARLRDEARDDLLAVLQDPLSNDTEQDRLKKVRVSYELSYRHLSDAGKRLFARLCRLPAGIWCGDFPERFLDWHTLLGDNWRTILQNELDYFALVHYAASGEDGASGTFTMLPPMLEFARQKYADGDDHDWESVWVNFWQQHISTWNGFLSGRLPDTMDLPADQRGTAGSTLQQLATVLFEQTQANWLTVFDHLVHTDGSAATSFLLDVVSFCQLTGQLALLKYLSQQGVDTLRTSDAAADLAPCLGTLGIILRNLGERDAARVAYTEALTIRRRLARQHPAAFEPNVATTLNNLGTVLGDLGERDAARVAYTEALTIYRRLARQHPAAFEPNVAMTLNNLGTVLGDLGERDAARVAYTEALDIYMPFVRQWPQAFEQHFLTMLRNYINVTEEDASDPWWQLWKQWQKGDATTEEREST